MKTFTLDELKAADDAQEGFCIECGATRECCEPDAREYNCVECGQQTVYGAEELMIMGRAR